MWYPQRASPHGLIASLVTAVALAGLMSVAHAGALTHTTQFAPPPEVGAQLGDITVLVQINEAETSPQHHASNNVVMIFDAKSALFGGGTGDLNQVATTTRGGAAGVRHNRPTFGTMEPPADSAWSIMLVHTEGLMIPNNDGVDNGYGDGGSAI